MYETLTGEIPIQSRNRRDLLELHQRAIPVSMCEKRPDLQIPPELDRIVLACLAKRAGQRPTNAHDLEMRLAQLDSERPIVSVTTRGGRSVMRSQPASSSNTPVLPSSNKRTLG